MGRCSGGLPDPFPPIQSLSRSIQARSWGAGRIRAGSECVCGGGAGPRNGASVETAPVKMAPAEVGLEGGCTRGGGVQLAVVPEETRGGEAELSADGVPEVVSGARLHAAQSVPERMRHVEAREIDGLACEVKGGRLRGGRPTLIRALGTSHELAVPLLVERL